MRRTFIIGVFFIFSGTGFAQMDSLHHMRKTGIGLDSILRAVSRHPNILKKSAEVEAAQRRISQRSSLMDPMMMLGVQNLPTNSFRFNEVPMTSKMIGLSQSFPFFGKRTNERSIGEKEVHSMQENTAEEENRLRRDIRLAFFDIAHLEKSVETYRHHLVTIAELIELSEHSLAVAKGTQQEILALKLESAETDSRIAEEESMINMRTADLSGASNMVITVIQYEETPELSHFSHSIGFLDSLAAVFRPALLELFSETEQSAFEIERARLLKYPDFSVGLSYMQRDAVAGMRQSDMLSAQLSFNLPVFSRKLNDAVAEQEALRTAKREEINAMKLEIHTMLGSLLKRMEGIRKEYQILKDEILPLSDLSLSTSQTNYQNNKATLNEVLRSELVILHEFHQKYQLQAEYDKAIAQIEYLTGIDLITR